MDMIKTHCVSVRLFLKKKEQSHKSVTAHYSIFKWEICNKPLYVQHSTHLFRGKPSYHTGSVEQTLPSVPTGKGPRCSEEISPGLLCVNEPRFLH